MRFSSNLPGFFDLKEDPSELRNGLRSPEYGKEIRRLAKALKHYAQTCNEPHMTSKLVKAGLDWAISERIPYDVVRP